MINNQVICQKQCLLGIYIVSVVKIGQSKNFKDQWINFDIFIICYILFWFFLVKFYKDRILGWNLINFYCISDFDIFMYVLNEFYCMEKGGWGEDGVGVWNEGVGGSV